MRIEFGLHEGQREIYQNLKRFNTIRAGRRFGKTVLCWFVLLDALSRGIPALYTTPQHKYTLEFIEKMLERCGGLFRKVNRNTGRAEFLNGTIFRFGQYQLSDIGVGTGIGLILYDECALTSDKPQDGLIKHFRIAAPAMQEYPEGRVVFVTSPREPFGDFFELEQMEGDSWAHFHAPIWKNPMKTVEEIERWRAETHPLIFRREYEAEWVDMSNTLFYVGAPFMQIENEDWSKYDSIFITCDSAYKGGETNDGTAIMVFGALFETITSSIGHQNNILKRLDVLDWDISQINSNLIASTLKPLIEQLNKDYKNFSKVFIEDKGSGITIVQQLSEIFGDQIVPMTQYSEFMTNYCKTERALEASKLLYGKKVMFTQNAYNKKVLYKGVEAPHLFKQLKGFRSYYDRQEDDLVDVFNYGILAVMPAAA